MSTLGSGHTGRHRPWRGVAVGLAVALGLLLWARLKLVTDTPRMVYADPKATSPAEPGVAPGAAAGAALDR